MPEILSSLTDVSLGFLTLNTAVAFYKSLGEPWTASFVALAYANLLLLFYCLRALEKVPPSDAPRKAKLKLAVLVLATTLNLTFTHQVSKLLPPPLTAAVWCLGGSVTVAGFYLFFLHPNAR